MYTRLQQILAIPGVRRLWIAQLVSVSGDFLAIFAALSLASFRLHATAAGILGIPLSYMLPLAVLGPLAGVFVDRWNPRRTMVASDLIRALLVLALPFTERLADLYAVLFCLSSVSIFFIPAQSVTLRSMAPRDGLLSVNLLFQQTLLGIRIASPALAGILVAHFGPASCFLLDSASFLFSAILLCRGVPQVARHNARPGAGRILSDMTAGIRFILTHRAVAFVMLAMATATFALSCSSPLLALFVRDLLRADVRLYGVISTLLGVGMLAGTQTVRRLAKRSTPPRLVLSGLAAISSGLALIAAATSPAVAAFGAFATGAGVGLLVVPAQTLIQTETPTALMGRVSSGVTSLVAFAQILGLLLSSATASSLGIRPIFWSSAATLAVLALIGAWKLAQQESPRGLLTQPTP